MFESNFTLSSVNTNVGYAWLDDGNAKCPYDGNQVIDINHAPVKQAQNHFTSPDVETDRQ